MEKKIIIIKFQFFEIIRSYLDLLYFLILSYESELFYN